MLRNKKGISLTTMVITVAIMFIILGTVVYSAVDSAKIRKLNNLYNDLRQLGDAVEMYYLKNNELPVYSVSEAGKSAIVIKKDDTADSIGKASFLLKTGVTQVQDANSFVNPNDYVTVKGGGTSSASYQYLNLSLLDNLSLNYPTSDYIINVQSHTIYSLTGITIDKKTYNYLPLTYTLTKYNEKYAVSGIRLNSNLSVANASNIYFSLSDDKMNLKDLLVFDSEETGDGLGEPQEVNFSLVNESKYYTLDENTGVLKRKINGISDASDFSDDYNADVVVSAINYGDTEPSVSKTFTISTSSINIYSTARKENVDHVNLVKKRDEDIYVYQRNKTGEKEYQILKNGFLSGQNNINIVPQIEDSEIVTATYNNNNNNSDKYVVFESGTKTGSTELVMEVQDYGLARDSIYVDVYNFEIYEGSAGSNTSINKINFSGLGETHQTNVKLNYEAPRGFKFDGIGNRVEWSIEDDNGVVTLNKDQDITKATLIPTKIGQTKLRCKVIIEGETLSEMLIPISVSGIERVDGEIIEDNTISFTKDEEKTINLKYTFGDKSITSYTFETSQIVPSADFAVVINDDNTFTVTYNGVTEVTGSLKITVVVGEERYEDTLSIVVV